MLRREAEWLAGPKRDVPRARPATPQLFPSAIFALARQSPVMGSHSLLPLRWYTYVVAIVAPNSPAPGAEIPVSLVNCYFVEPRAVIQGEKTGTFSCG